VNVSEKRSSFGKYIFIIEYLSVLKQDVRIRADVFTEQFTAERFADVLFSLMLSALLRQDYDPTAVLEIVRRTLY
jgi:hypothetical protein